MSRSPNQQELRELLSRVREIEIKSRRLTEGAVAGQYRTAFRGTGIEFEEVREYNLGDDIRSIDWNVTARSGKLHVKKFREERERTVLLAIDVSGSSSFGTRVKTKKYLAAELAAVFSLSALSSKDKIGCMLFSDRIEKMILPKRGRSHVLRIVRDVLGHQTQSLNTDITNALEHLNHILPRRTIIILVSDFLTTGFESAIRHTALRHDLVPIILEDPAEQEGLQAGLFSVKDAESGQIGSAWFGSKKIRRMIRDEFEKRKLALKIFFSQHRIDSLWLLTNHDYGKPLLEFFRRRVSRQ